MGFSSFLGQYFQAIGQLWTISWWWAGPIVLFWLFKILWKKYSLGLYLGTMKWIVLEIKPPRNIERSPRTMEQVFAALHGVWSTPNYIDKYVRGKWIQSFISFEIQGVNGEMHFMIRCERKFRNFIESLIYSQYPEAEIQEVEDYTLSVPKNTPNAEWDLWGVDFKKAKDDAYPIRTYKYFQEDVTKGMIDPLAELADVCAALPPGQQIWIQIVVTPEHDKDWQKAVKKVADKLAQREVAKEPFFIFRFFQQVWEIISLSFSYISKPELEFATEKKKEEQPIIFKLTPGEQEILKAVEESVTKKGYRTKLRFIYIGRREGFDRGFLSGVNGAMQQFNDMMLNSFAHENETKTFANYIWVEPRMRYAQRKIFNRYLDRDFDGPSFVMNSEELATIYHMPDMSVVSPAISRVEAKKGGAPLNLPIE
ncbi:MAG TPA: hypothetical protein VK254_02870 [Candidatus Bathyarchaeia archaeon]|nr:hypothetical protein [Candidatus Bathyarchaeia archaeon]